MTSFVSEAFLSNLLSEQGLAFACFDIHGALLTHSARFSAYLFEPQSGHLQGKQLLDLLPELVGYDSWLADRNGKLVIDRIYRPDLFGQPGYVDLQVSAYADGWLVVVRDVTREGLLDQKVIQQRNELRLEIAARQRAEAELQLLNAELERRVAERTDALESANQRLRALSRRLVELQEQERRHMAQELHDEIGQLLTGLKLSLGLSARLPYVEIGAALAGAQELVSDLLDQVRQMSLDLRPAMLDDFGLLPALFWYFERYTGRTQITIDFQHSDLERRFQPEIESAAYRIIQEALTNVARHAGVEQVRIRLWFEPGWLLLAVEDNGRGFDLPAALAAGRSSGLAGMRERAGLLGGELEIGTAAGRGTEIQVRLPVDIQSLEVGS
ncbi:MAG: sensor histidine kinase [Anaerolineales bacterium]|nr:sensor histidine kinase [Anaerolineales bacterium]